MKKFLLVYGKEHHAVLTVQVVLFQGVLILLAAADGEPSAFVTVIGFPNDPVAHIRIGYLGD